MSTAQCWRVLTCSFARLRRHLAAQLGQDAAIKILLRWAVSGSGRHCVRLASFQRRAPCCSLRTFVPLPAPLPRSAGANPMPLNGLQQTPLALAAACGQESAARLLLAAAPAAADVADAAGDLPLHAAAEQVGDCTIS